ncbi:MAG: ComEC/Rec2 family competence protein, partial [Gemmatimonadetes bacterium]|nr:ComEC/Rec2 family competence protein [Gemmatimonadota bacterium]
MAALAGACAAGCALAGLAGPDPHLARAAPLLLLALLAPAWPWRRPHPSASLAAAAAAGMLLALAAERRESAGCLPRLPDGAALAVVGHLEAPAVAGRGSLRIESGLGSCRPVVRAVLAPPAAEAGPGVALSVRGRWMASGQGGAWAGTLRVEDAEPVAGARPRALPAVRGGAVAVLHRRFADRGPVAAALVVARKEGLDPGLREAFVRSGTAHLLAISGFHVGVVAALLYTLLRWRGRGVSRRRGALLASAAVWAYVLGIGAPDAAVRAALALSLAALGTLRGRPAAGEGTLAAAFLLVAVVDPGALLRPGAQLSFAGAWGLVRWGSNFEAGLRRRLPDGVAGALAPPLAAGCAATLGTLPVVAWHFERLSLVGIPATLVAGPLVALAVPGLLATLMAEVLHPAAGAFVAGGVDVLLAVLIAVVEAFAAAPFASVDLPRSWTVTMGTGALAAGGLLRARRVRPVVRMAVAGAGALAAFQLWPVALRIAEAGSVEVVAVDVGQGDALLVRSPRGRWLVVDAGPSFGGRDAGRDRVLPYLRGRGVSELEAVVLTHPHLDHVGGAAALLEAMDVGGVLDPGAAVGIPAYLATLAAAERAGAGWWAARAGAAYRLDGLTIRVLQPESIDRVEEDANAVSVVLHVSWGLFSVLLTGDAPGEMEVHAVRDLVDQARARLAGGA